MEQWCGTQLHLPSFSSDPHSSFTSLVSFLCFSFSGFFLHLLSWLHPTTPICSPFEQEHDLLEAFPWIRCQLKRRLFRPSTPIMAPVPRQHISPSRHVRQLSDIVRHCQAGAILASGSIRFYVRKFFPCSFFFDRLSPLVV